MTKSVTLSELVAQYLRLENHVSAAPWAEVSVPLNYDGFVGSGDGRAGYFITVRHGHGDALEAQSRHDAAFIVWCRNNVPTLVAHLKDALAEVEASKAKADLWQRSCEGWPVPAAMNETITELRGDYKGLMRHHEDACLARDRFEADRDRLSRALDRVRALCERFERVERTGIGAFITPGEVRACLDGPHGAQEK